MEILASSILCGCPPAYTHTNTHFFASYNNPNSIGIAWLNTTDRGKFLNCFELKTIYSQQRRLTVLANVLSKCFVMLIQKVSKMIFWNKYTVPVNHSPTKWRNKWKEMFFTLLTTLTVCTCSACWRRFSNLTANHLILFSFLFLVKFAKKNFSTKHHHPPLLQCPQQDLQLNKFKRLIFM